MVVFFGLTAAQDMALAEKIKSVSEDLLAGYTEPLVDAFGTGVATGLFHTARSHQLLGFDIGVRTMFIQIPDLARYFSGQVLVCSLAGNDLVYDSLVLDSISTIFGPSEETVIPTTGNQVGIPPEIPRGFNVSLVPLIMPQLNVGLIYGTELAIRYIPFSYKGSRLNFLGIGIKQHLNRLPGVATLPIPIDIAVGGAIQNLGLADSLNETIMSSRTWSLQAIASKNLTVLEPLIGAGLENTTVTFNYEFEYDIPDTINNVPEDRIRALRTVNIELDGKTDTRVFVGFNLKLAVFYLHYDYTLVSRCKTHNIMAGFGLR